MKTVSLFLKLFSAPEISHHPIMLHKGGKINLVPDKCIYIMERLSKHYVTYNRGLAADLQLAYRLWIYNCLRALHEYNLLRVIHRFIYILYTPHGNVKHGLRIDNSWCSVICAFGLVPETMSCTFSLHTSKNRADFFLSDDVIDIFMGIDFI